MRFLPQQFRLLLQLTRRLVTVGLSVPYRAPGFAAASGDFTVCSNSEDPTAWHDALGVHPRVQDKSKDGPVPPPPPRGSPSRPLPERVPRTEKEKERDAAAGAADGKAADARPRESRDAERSRASRHRTLSPVIRRPIEYGIKVGFTPMLQACDNGNLLWQPMLQACGQWQPAVAALL